MDTAAPMDEAAKVSGFVRAVETEPQVTPVVVVNPDEIELEESSSEEEEEESKEDVERKAIPAGVFGGLAEKVEAEKAAPKEKLMGAKDRFKRKRVEEMDDA